MATNVVVIAGRAPDATLRSVIAMEVKRKGEASRCVRVAPATYALWRSVDLEALPARAHGGEGDRV